MMPLRDALPSVERLQPKPLRQRSILLGNVRFEECICGGWLVANITMPGSITQVVRDHQLTRLHRDWQLERNRWRIPRREYPMSWNERW